MEFISIGEPAEVNLIDPKVYSNKNILELIKIIGDPENNFSIKEIEALIANIVVKYLMLYLLNLPIDAVMPLEHVNMFYGWMTAISSITRQKGICAIALPVEVNYFIRAYQPVMHAASLISDVASTTVIIRDMVLTTIDSRKDRSQYVGLDLGTGSGILMIAMQIQAMRNRFKKIMHVGIDSHAESIKRAGITLKKFSDTKILIEGDSTSEHTYATFARLALMPTFIANETLPKQGSPFYTPGHPGEPFFKNHNTLQQVFGAEEMRHIDHFPYGVDVLISDGKERQKTFLASRENGYMTSAFPPHTPEEFFHFFSPQRVQNTQASPLQSLASVGDEIRQKTWDPSNARRIIPANSLGELRWASSKHLDERFS